MNFEELWEQACRDGVPPALEAARFFYDKLSAPESCHPVPAQAEAHHARPCRTPPVAPVPQALIDQFPPLPEYVASWQAIYMEPVMGSGERVAVAVIAFDADGCEVLVTLSESRLQALFGEQADGMATMIGMVAGAAQKHGQAGHLLNFKPPLGGVIIGELREAMGDDRADVLQQTASLSSSFYERS
ncbi:hypothetical protein RZ737_004862 [Escherichia coli]|nr:hypothetical protein [Escherichia coli]